MYISVITNISIITHKHILMFQLNNKYTRKTNIGIVQ
jgi:hypothetical protein